jgi:hypothetical protein
MREEYSQEVILTGRGQPQSGTTASIKEHDTSKVKEVQSELLVL